MKYIFGNVHVNYIKLLINYKLYSNKYSLTFILSIYNDVFILSFLINPYDSYNFKAIGFKVVNFILFLTKISLIY